MFKAERTKALYAGSFDPITRGHLDVIGKALATFDEVHVAVGTNVRKKRVFEAEESLGLIASSILDHWPEAACGSLQDERSVAVAFFEGALRTGEFTNQSLVKYARSIGATHIVRGMRTPGDFNEEFSLHGMAERIDPSLTMVHFICDAPFIHVSSSAAKELNAMGEDLRWLVTPSVEAALLAKRPDPKPRRE